MLSQLVTKKIYFLKVCVIHADTPVYAGPVTCDNYEHVIHIRIYVRMYAYIRSFIRNEVLLLVLQLNGFIYIRKYAGSQSCPYDGDFRCSNGACVRSYEYCNGRCDCWDCSDEDYCSKYYYH